MQLDLAKDGATVAQAPVELPAADANGRIAAVATFPLASIPPGSYDVSITVRQGAATATEKGSFVIVP
jgi:hypothetical protein